MSYKFLKSVKFIKSMFPAGTFFRSSWTLQALGVKHNKDKS